MLHCARHERASKAWTELQREHCLSSRELKNSYEGMLTSPLGQEKLSLEKKEEFQDLAVLEILSVSAMLSDLSGNGRSLGFF